jgi:hypothetical protein
MKMEDIEVRPGCERVLADMRFARMSRKVNRLMRDISSRVKNISHGEARKGDASKYQ